MPKRFEQEIIEAVADYYQRDLELMKGWIDRNGPFIDLTSSEQLARYNDPTMRGVIEQIMLATKGPVSVAHYRAEMEKLAAEDRRRGGLV